MARFAVTAKITVEVERQINANTMQEALDIGRALDHKAYISIKPGGSLNDVNTGLLALYNFDV